MSGITVYDATRLGMAIARATGDPVHMTVSAAADAGRMVHERFRGQGRKVTVIEVMG